MRHHSQNVVLFALLGLGDLERAAMMAGKTEVGVVTGKGNVKKAQYALEASAKVLPYYNDYFGVDFPLPKLDNVAGPGQSQFFSAMENWGAIFTFDRVLLDDPRITTEADKQRIFVVLAHEMAHRSEEHTSELQSLMRNSY